MNSAATRYRGLALRDLLILLVCILLGWAMLTPTLNRVRCYAWWELCTSNLRQIGGAMFVYAQDHRGAFPRTRWEPGAAPTAFTSPTATDPFGDDGPQSNDVTASLYLLVRTQDVKLDLFLCPLTKSYGRSAALIGNPKVRSNFLPQQLLYSMANPFPDAKATNAVFRWSDTLGAEFALLADMNPGSAVLGVGSASSASAIRRANTRNHHSGDGQSVLYGDGHVELQSNSFVGVMRDNIYTLGPFTARSGGLGIVGSPTSPDDSVLLPVATFDPGARLDPWTRDRRRDLALSMIWWMLVTAALAIAATQLVRNQRVRLTVIWLYNNASRARRRTRSGLCPKCGYDVRATPNRCPECGFEFPDRAQR